MVSIEKQRRFVRLCEGFRFGCGYGEFGGAFVSKVGVLCLESVSLCKKGLFFRQ